MTRRKKQIKKSVLMIIILTILISIGLYFLLFSKSTGGLLVRSKDKTAKFDYTLDKDNTNLMKENFKELKDILANDNINYEDYAKIFGKPSYKVIWMIEGNAMDFKPPFGNVVQITRQGD